MEHFGFPLEALVMFFGVIALSVYLDLRAHRNVEEMSLKESFLWSVFWIGIALAFYGYLLVRHEQAWAELFLSGYFREKTLTLVTLMLFMAMFASFSIKGALRNRILYWGIVGSLAFRAVFVFVGASLSQAIPWVGFIVAVVVAWSAWAKATAEYEITDYTNHWAARIVKRVLPVFPRMHRGMFLISRDEVEQRASENCPAINRQGEDNSRAFWHATPALLCLSAIWISGAAMAAYSGASTISQSQDPMPFYAATIFSILGLRSLYFLLTALTRHLVHLEDAAVLLLVFFAATSAVQSCSDVFGDANIIISPTVSAGVTLGVIALGVIASLFQRAFYSSIETAPGEDVIKYERQPPSPSVVSRGESDEPFSRLPPTESKAKANAAGHAEQREGR